MHAIIKNRRSINSRKQPRSIVGIRGYLDKHGHTLLSSSNNVHITFAAIPQYPYFIRKTYQIHPEMPRKTHLTSHVLCMVATNTWFKYNKYVWTICIDQVLHI